MRIGSRRSPVRNDSAARIPEALAAAAGPFLIAVSVLVALHWFWLPLRLTSQQVDLMSFWLPRFCFLGESLSSGHIPTWLPNQFGGVPFASDPQSGWLYLPPMALFTLFSCGRALGMLILLNPILAGLGLYWFFRKEGLGRPASTVGGLTISLAMCGASVALSLPFAGTLAWTSIALVGAAGYLQARTTLGLVGWLGLTGFAWWQLAGAHLTHGLLMGTFVVGTYVMVRVVSQVRAGDRSWKSAALVAGGLAVSLPLLAAGSLIPRFALLPRTSIGHGYRELARIATDLSGTTNVPPFAEGGVEPLWGTAFARAPGGYVGIVAILLLFVALASRRWRAPAVAFLSIGVLCYLLNLDAIVSSEGIRNLALGTPFGELWLRSPVRFRYPVLIVFAAAGAYGLQAWLDLDREAPWGRAVRRLLWVAPAVLLFALLPLAADGELRQYLSFAFGLMYAVPLLVLLARGARWPALALPVLLGVELVATALIAQAGGLPNESPNRLELVSPTGTSLAFPRFRQPTIDPERYLTPGPIGRALIEARESYGRYLSFDRAIATNTVRGFLARQQPRDWPHQENGRSILFDLHEIQGYSPVQVDRYWRLVRKANDRLIYYNSATFQSIEPSILRLFGVEWLILRRGGEPPSEAIETAREGEWVLYRLDDPQPRASLVHRWSELEPDAALEAVLRPSFDPAREALLDPGDGRDLPTPPGASAPPGATVTYREVAPNDIRIDVSSEAPGLLVVRNVFDSNWHATVDGEDVDLLRVDYLMQGVEVPAGSHEIRVTYRDDAIGLALLVAASSWGAMIGASIVLWARGRRRKPERPQGA
jgi:hypothetical protein